MSFFTLPWMARPSRGPRQPYTGEQLRAIRKKNGVGKTPNRAAKFYTWVAMAKQVNAMAAKVNSVKNFAEWLRKPRKKVRAS